MTSRGGAMSEHYSQRTAARLGLAHRSKLNASPGMYLTRKRAGIHKLRVEEELEVPRHRSKVVSFELYTGLRVRVVTGV